MILHGIEYQRPTSLNMRILADHVTYSFLAFMKSIFHFCLGCYCGGYSQNGRSNLSSWYLVLSHQTKKIIDYWAVFYFYIVKSLKCVVWMWHDCIVACQTLPTWHWLIRESADEALSGRVAWLMKMDFHLTKTLLTWMDCTCWEL